MKEKTTSAQRETRRGRRRKLSFTDRAPFFAWRNRDPLDSAWELIPEQDE